MTSWGTFSIVTIFFLLASAIECTGGECVVGNHFNKLSHSTARKLVQLLGLSSSSERDIRNIRKKYIIKLPSNSHINVRGNYRARLVLGNLLDVSQEAVRLLRLAVFLVVLLLQTCVSCLSDRSSYS